MASPIQFPIDDKELDDAALWAVIDSAAASYSLTKSCKLVPLKPSNLNHQSPISFSTPSPPTKLSKNPRRLPQSEVVQHCPQKMARSCVTEMSETSPTFAVVKHVQRSPIVTSPYSYPSPENGRYTVTEVSPVPEVNHRQLEERENAYKHCLSGHFPSVSAFKDYQNAAMLILEKTDYTMISGNPFIKKSGWRKISFYFNLSYEIRDKTIEFDENRNVLRAEFVVRAFMQGGRFSDGWGSCDRREKRFTKPNHDIPSTAETRAKNKACQDLLGIGEYRPGAGNNPR
ncbi:hypothetical protein RJ641_028334 [Dillenia turbinata]|uniref:Uncharacterized protein n=1 Tax=Dillenia turbinata TaxID=194707 RepID=A0AAN8WBS1_9MAGN